MKNIYSLDCSYFNFSFDSITGLLEHIIITGSDPNYEITKNGNKTGEMAIDLLK